MLPHNAPTVPRAGTGVLQQGRGEDEWPDDVKQSSRFRATNPSSVPPGGEQKKKGRAGREGIKPKPVRLRKIFPNVETLLGDAGAKPGISFLQLAVIDTAPGASGEGPGDTLSEGRKYNSP